MRVALCALKVARTLKTSAYTSGHLYKLDDNHVTVADTTESINCHKTILHAGEGLGTKLTFNFFKLSYFIMTALQVGCNTCITLPTNLHRVFTSIFYAP